MPVNPNFPVIRGPDAQQNRTQDGITNVLGSVAKAVINTPIMGAPPPPWIKPSLLNGWISTTAGIAFISFHKDALGYVHVGGYGTNAAGVAGFTPVFTMPPGYRPNGVRIFAVRGTALSAQFVEVAPDGIVRTQIVVAAGGDCTFEFSYLAER